MNIPNVPVGGAPFTPIPTPSWLAKYVNYFIVRKITNLCTMHAASNRCRFYPGYQTTIMPITS